jgi:hypothetical protein
MKIRGLNQIIQASHHKNKGKIKALNAFRKWHAKCPINPEQTGL